MINTGTASGYELENSRRNRPRPGARAFGHQARMGNQAARPVRARPCGAGVSGADGLAKAPPGEGGQMNAASTGSKPGLLNGKWPVRRGPVHCHGCVRIRDELPLREMPPHHRVGVQADGRDRPGRTCSHPPAPPTSSIMATPRPMTPIAGTAARWSIPRFVTRPTPMCRSAVADRYALDPADPPYPCRFQGALVRDHRRPAAIPGIRLSGVRLAVRLFLIKMGEAEDNRHDTCSHKPGSHAMRKRSQRST